MKVYELMEELSKVSAGAEVVVEVGTTVESLTQKIYLSNTDHGEKIYCFRTSVCEIEDAETPEIVVLSTTVVE